MRTLVIHPSDRSTDFLRSIYADKDWTVVRDALSKSKLTKFVKEHDRIVMLGHGTEDGLINVGKNGFAIDSRFVYLLREKICVYVWCNADKFVSNYKLKSPLFTGMIVSEFGEADYFGLPCVGIDESNALFASTVKAILERPESFDEIKPLYNIEGNMIVDYNKNNIYKNT